MILKIQLVKIKQLFFNPFVISIGFTVLANLIQVFAFIAQGKLDDFNFSLLNWGVYVFTLVIIPIEAFTKFLTIELGKLEVEHRISFLWYMLKKSLPALGVFMLILSLLIYSFDNRSLPIIALCFISGLIGLLFSYPRALLNVQSKFLEFNFLNLFIPVVRLFFTIFFVFNGQITILFFGLTLSSVLSLFASLFFVRKDIPISLKLFSNLRALPSFGDKKVLAIINNVLLQIALSSFWLVDGLVLRKFLDDYNYSVYVSYSYIYKFPMFATVGIVPVLLGKAVISEENKKDVKNVLKKSILIILSLFGAFLIFEFLFEGLILKVLGYSRYFMEGFAFIFGFAWLAQTILHFLFLYLLKIKTSLSLYFTIFLYSITFIFGLYFFRENIFQAMWFVLGQGLFFIMVNFALSSFKK